MSTEKRESRSLGLIIGAFTLVYLIGIGVIVLATAAWGGGGSGSGSGSGSDESILNISLSEFAIKGDLNATPGKITINITNDGSVAHDFQIADLGILTDKIAPGVSTTVVIEDAPELKIVATNSVGETVDATPVPVDKQLFIRGQKHLFCIAK